MLKSFFCSKEWVPWAWGGLAFLLTAIVVEVQLQVLLTNGIGNLGFIGRRGRF